MTNEKAWGAALQSLGGSISDYYREKMQNSEQEACDHRLAQAVIDKEIRDKQTAIEEEQRQAAIDSIRKYMEGRTIMKEAQPGISYPTAAGPQSYLGPVMGPAIPALTPYDYLGGFTTPETPAREVYPTEVPGIFKSLYGGRPTPGYRFAKPEPKPMTEYEAARSKLAAEKEERLKKYGEYTRRVGLMGKLTDAQIADIYKTVDDKYDLDFNLLGKLRQGLITQDEIDEMKAAEKLNLVRSVVETGKAARGGTLPTKPKEKESKSSVLPGLSD